MPLQAVTTVRSPADGAVDRGAPHPESRTPVRPAVARLLAGDAAEVAPMLLGWTVATEFRGARTAVCLTEVEAYGGADDPASHAFRGPTKRNASMYLPAGHLYVYLSYGTHVMANVVTGRDGEGSAILLRGGEPIEGRSVMERRRHRTDHLTDGPGKLAQALGVQLGHDGTRLGPDAVSMAPGSSPREWRATPRIGISRATERPWRFIALPA